jgi:FkbM family methyltransferase
VKLPWRIKVGISRWTHRAAYASRAPLVYRNWWAAVFPKLGYPATLLLRDGRRYRVRPGTSDLAVINEAAFLDPYLSNGFVSLQRGSVVVDIGANVGDFAIQAARLCPDGRVIAVEPVRSAGEMIAEHAHLNAVSNVKWIWAAVSGKNTSTHVRTAANPYALSDERQDCPTITLAGLLADEGLERVDLLKLDCEGAEWDILPASEAVLSRIRQICMEFHCERGWTAPRIAEWLRNRGYTVTYTSGDWNGLLWARRS